MSRTIDASLLSALTSDQCEPFFAVDLDFDVRLITDVNGDEITIEPLYLWTGVGDRTIGSNTYLGTGQMLTIGGMEEVSDLSAKSMSLTLDGVDSAIVSIALQEPYQRRKVRVYMGEKSVSSVVQIFSGQMDQMSIQDTGETSSITLVIESKLVELERARNWRYTNESHKSRYPDDTFFSFVQDLQDKSVAWGREPK